MHSPDTITTPVAPIRKVRRRALTLERQESRGRTRAAKFPTETESSGDEVDDEDVSISKDSSKTSLPTTENSSMPMPEVSDLSTSPVLASPPVLPIPRPSIATAAPRYILRKAFKRM